MIQEWQPLLRDRIYHYIKHHPNSSLYDIIGAIGGDERTIRRYIKVFEQKGLISSFTQDRIKRYI
jgi:predicted transcriptional regulator